MLHCSIIPVRPLSTLRPSTRNHMINVFLAIVPLGLATGALVWTMSTGAREQQRSDKWAAQWMRDNT
ncbi:MAG TPA: hypothetical protein VLE45_01175 [Burkholderiaceae bacterium]|nr:hypothetical protein [Burkholderiaceae bacterium]